VIEIFVEWQTQKRLSFFGFQSKQRHVSFSGVQKYAETKIKLPTSLFHQDHDQSVAEN
jgi:hypothetical protein